MKLSADTIAAALGPNSLWVGKITAEDCVDSTNTRLKAMALHGAPEGSVMAAEEQTGGRGTRGRSFFSPRGEGLYLSVLLRPGLPVSELFTLTGWTAVAVRRGILAACGAPVEIKWLNDLYLGGRKVCGILTELCPDGGVVIGVGINLTQREETFRAQGLENIACSLAEEGYPVESNALCAHILRSLEEMYRDFPHGGERWLEEYRAHCLTPGRQVAFEEGGRQLRGRALAVAGDFSLTVEGEDGEKRRVFAGTVSLI